MASLMRFIAIGLGIILAVHQCHSQVTCPLAAMCTQYSEGDCVNGLRLVCIRRVFTGACIATTLDMADACETSAPLNTDMFRMLPDFVCKPNVPGGNQVQFSYYEEELSSVLVAPGPVFVAGYNNNNGLAVCTGYETGCGVGMTNDVTITFTTMPCPTTTTTTTTTTITPTTTTVTPNTTTMSTTTPTTQIPGCTCTTAVAVGQCPVTCGSGIQTFQRICTGAACLPAGSQVYSGPCPAPRPLCPVPGGWSHWSPVVGCTATCGIGTGTRTRTCTSPAPTAGGTCAGASTESMLCVLPTCASVTVAPRRGRPGRRGQRGQRGRRGRPGRGRGRRGGRRGGGRGGSRRPRRGRPNRRN